MESDGKDRITGKVKGIKIKGDPLKQRLKKHHGYGAGEITVK